MFYNIQISIYLIFMPICVKSFNSKYNPSSSKDIMNLATLKNRKKKQKLYFKNSPNSPIFSKAPSKNRNMKLAAQESKNRARETSASKSTSTLHTDRAKAEIKERNRKHTHTHTYEKDHKNAF